MGRQRRPAPAPVRLRVQLGGFIDGTDGFGFDNETVTFDASANVHVAGLTNAQLEIERSPEGVLSGRAELPVNLANFAGSVVAQFTNGAVNIEGKAGYTTEKLSGEVTLLVTDADAARDVAVRRLAAQAPQAVQAGAEAAAEPEAGTVQAVKPGPRALAGWGVLNFAFTEWLTGQAQVIVDRQGQVTVVGEITPPAEVELFAQRDYTRQLFKAEARALNGVPLVGNLFVFANIGMEAAARTPPIRACSTTSA